MTVLDEEVLFLRETAHRIASRCRLESARDRHPGCWEAVRSAGLTELRMADENGQPAGSVAMTTVVVEELARAVCAAPLLGHLLATELLRLAGAAVLAESGPLTVVVDQNLHRLASAPEGVALDAGLADRGVVRVGKGVAVVRLGNPVATVDPSRPLRPVLEATAGVGQLRSPPEFDVFARVLLTADLLGAATGLFDDALDYVKNRKQFGVPVGSFQAVQHLLAQAHVGLEATRSILEFAVRAAEASTPEASRLSLAAKSYANEAALDAVHAAVQVFGGIAITSEHRAHLHLRRVLLDRELFGTSEDLDVQMLEEGHR